MITIANREAIDVHVHVHNSTRPTPTDEVDAAYRDAAKTYFGVDGTDASLPGIADHYRARNMGCVVFTVDSETVDGRAAVPNEEIAEYAADNADVMLAFGSVDPWKGEIARRTVRRLIDDYGVKGFKFHPSAQAFYPDDQRFYPLYRIIEDAGLPVIFHTGQSGMGAGMRGGGGYRIKYSNPLHLDDVAADFPDLKIIMAHPSVPWQDEALAIALHKPNLYIDLSGWSPKYFEPKLVTYANRMLKDKMLFGSDFPLLQPDRWLRDFEQLPIDDDVRPKILRTNALRVLGLDQDAPVVTPEPAGSET